MFWMDDFFGYIMNLIFCKALQIANVAFYSGDSISCTLRHRFSLHSNSSIFLQHYTPYIHIISPKHHPLITLNSKFYPQLLHIASKSTSPRYFPHPPSYDISFSISEEWVRAWTTVRATNTPN